MKKLIGPLVLLGGIIYLANKAQATVAKQITDRTTAMDTATGNINLPNSEAATGNPPVMTEPVSMMGKLI